MRQEGFKRKKLLWKDFVLLAGTILAAAALVVLPTYPVLRWQGEVVFQIGNFAGILIGYVLFLAGIWLPERFSACLAEKGRRILHACSGLLILAGLIPLTVFPLQNPLKLHTEAVFILVLILWPLLHGTVQYILCRKGKNIVLRCIPVYLCLLELLFTAYLYFDPFDVISGWDELGALIVSVLTVPPAGAVLLAWLLWWGVRRRKVQEKE